MGILTAGIGKYINKNFKKPNGYLPPEIFRDLLL